MADSFAQAAAKFQKLSDKLNGPGLRSIVTRVATQSKGDFDKEVVAALGSDMTFSGWRKHPKLKVSFDLVSDHQAKFRGKPAGIWKVAERGRRSGARAPKKGVKVLATPWGLRRYSSQRPLIVGGTAGKAVFSKGSDRAGKEAPKRVHVEVRKAIGEVF